MFAESVVQYLRGEIGVPIRVLPKLLRSKVMKYHNLDPMEGSSGAEFVEYNFDKAAKEIEMKLRFVLDIR